MSLQNENELEDKIFDETIDPIVDPIYDIICKSSIRGIMSNVKQLVDISPVKFKFGFKFYNYYDVIFEYENERITWKAISCKKGEEEITNNKLYNPMESQNSFVWVEEEGKWFSPDKKKKIRYDNGWKYEGGRGVVEEFTVLKSYKLKTAYKTSTIGNRAFMQAHHGIQSKWARQRINNLSRKLNIKNMYNPDEAPVILLRDTHISSPHQYITNEQAQRKSFNKSNKLFGAKKL